MAFSNTDDTQDTDSTQEDWIPLTEAARELGISHSKLSKMTRQGRVQTRTDMRDERVKLVNIVALRTMFNRQG